MHKIEVGFSYNGRGDNREHVATVVEITKNNVIYTTISGATRVKTKDAFAEYYEVAKENWKPELGDLFYIVGVDGEIVDRNNNGSLALGRIIAFGNCFRTKEEAETMRDTIKALMAVYRGEDAE